MELTEGTLSELTNGCDRMTYAKKSKAKNDPTNLRAVVCARIFLDENVFDMLGLGDFIEMQFNSNRHSLNLALSGDAWH